MKPINQSQNHGIANRIVSLLISACKVVLQIFTFVLNGKPGSVISPTFPIYYHHLWGGFHCWSHSMRLFAFILGERGSFFFSFVDVVFFWRGGGEGILDRVPKHSLLSPHYDLWVWEKKTDFAFLVSIFPSPSCAASRVCWKATEWEWCLFHSDPSEMQERLQNN